MTTSKYFPGLDTLRAAAIGAVILFHAREILTGDFVGPHLKAVFNHGWAGVDLFFVLSGFLIGSQLITEARREGRVDFAKFYIKRIFRILPAYYAVLLAYQVWPAFREKPLLDPAWKFLLFTFNYGRTGDAFSHAWSLCVEEHFYLILPLVVAGAARWPRVVRPAWLVALLLVGSVVWRYKLWLDGAAFFPAVYRPSHTHFDGLIVGAALALLRESRRAHWEAMVARPRVLFISGLAAVTAGLWLYRDLTGVAGYVFSFSLVSVGFGALVASATAPTFWLATARIPGIPTLAALAFALYLTHKQMLHLAKISVPNYMDHPAATVGLAVAFIASAAFALHYGIERPFLGLRERLLRRAVVKAETQPLPLKSDGR